MTDRLAEFSTYLDASIRARFAGMTREELEDELLLLHRTIKVVEEMGEVVGALIGLTGANPRKGVTATEYDLADEFDDVAVSVMGAREHLMGNTGKARSMLDAKVAYVHERAGLGPAREFWGIQKPGDPDSYMGWSHWTEEDARQAAVANSNRWGPYEVVEPTTNVVETGRVDD